MNCNKDEFGGEPLKHFYQQSLQWGCLTPRPPATEPVHQAPASLWQSQLAGHHKAQGAAGVWGILYFGSSAHPWTGALAVC